MRLALAAGNQVELVRAFLAPLGIRWVGELTKALDVFEFADCEVVYYVARTEDKVITCISRGPGHRERRVRAGDASPL